MVISTQSKHRQNPRTLLLYFKAYRQSYAKDLVFEIISELKHEFAILSSCGNTELKVNIYKHSCTGDLSICVLEKQETHVVNYKPGENILEIINKGNPSKLPFEQPLWVIQILTNCNTQ
mgnify:CR=1 FL=1